MEDNDPTGYKEAMRELTPKLALGCAIAIMQVANFPTFLAVTICSTVPAWRTYRNTTRDVN